MNTLILFRKYLLITGQVLGIFICSFFILQSQSYDISLGSWLIYILPESIITKINGVFSFIGTFILIIPLTIIILSLLMPNNHSLKLMGGFFGIGGTLLVCFSGILKDTISEVYNMRIFQITKILPLEEKRLIFKTEFLRIIDVQHKNMIDLYNYLQQQLLESKFTIYDVKLTDLKETLAIKIYASEIVQQYINLYYQEKSIVHQENNATSILQMKHYLIIGGVILGVFLVFTIVSMLIDKEPLREGAVLMKDNALATDKMNDSLLTTQQITHHAITETIPNAAVNAAAVVGNKVSASMKELHESITTSINMITNKLKVVEDRLTNVEQSVKVCTTWIKEHMTK